MIDLNKCTCQIVSTQEVGLEIQAGLGRQNCGLPLRVGLVDGVAGPRSLGRAIFSGLDSKSPWGNDPDVSQAVLLLEAIVFPARGW